MLSGDGESEATEGRTGKEELPERWSARRKAEVLLRLLRGEDLGEVSRELQVSPVELEEWRPWISDPDPGPPGAHSEGGMIKPPYCPANRNRPP